MLCGCPNQSLKLPTVSVAGKIGELLQEAIDLIELSRFLCWVFSSNTNV